MNIIKNLRKPQFAIFFAFLILFVSCEQYDREDLAENQIDNTSIKFSGQELFSSIIFMDGEATSLFPIIEKNFELTDYLNTPEKKEEYKNMQQNAIEFINEENPDFFANFQKNMYSQNPIVIKKALMNGTEILIPFINKELKDTGLKYKVDLNNPKEFEKLKKEFKNDYDKFQKISLIEDEEDCGVLALAAAVVAVAAALIWIVVVSEVAFWSAQLAPDYLDERALLPDELTLEIVEGLY